MYLPAYRTWIIHKNGHITMLPDRGTADGTVLLIPSYAPVFSARLPLTAEIFTVGTPVEPGIELTPEDRAKLLRIGHALGVYIPGARTPVDAVQFLDGLTRYERPDGKGCWSPRRGEDEWVVVRRRKARRLPAPPVVVLSHRACA